MNIHQIVELSDGIFETILDFPDQNKLLDSIIENSLPYILLTDLSLGDFTWQNYNLTGVENLSGLTRHLRGDFVVSTNEFLDKYKNYSWMYAIQLREVPPNYFEFNKIAGKQRYKALKDCGFRFIVQSQPGGGDYVSLITQSSNLLEKAIEATTV